MTWAWLIAWVAAVTPEVGDPPPIQRPKSLQTLPATQPPKVDAPVDPAPVVPPSAVEAAPVTSPPEQPTRVSPPPVAAPPAIDMRLERGTAPLPIEVFDAVPEHAPQPGIPRFYRRPGIWLGVGLGSLAAASAMHLALPRAIDSLDDENACGSGPAIGLALGVIPFDVMSLIGLGFAGRGYGLRRNREGGAPSRTRLGLVVGGVALSVVGGAMTITAAVGGLLDERLSAATYTSAGLRVGGIALGGLGAALLGYGIAVRPRGERPGGHARLAVAPNIGPASLGVTLSIRSGR